MTIQKRSLQVIILLLTFSLLFVLVSCKKGPTNNKEPETKKPVKLVAVELPITYSTVTHIANAKGFVEKEGLDYEVISVPAGPDIITSLKGGGTKTANVGSIAITPVISMIGAGDHPVVLATALQSNERIQLVTFSDSGITENPSTLKGKKIGVVLGTVGEIYLTRLLSKGSLTDKDVVSVNGRPADLNNLFLRGDLDAIVSWEPWVARAIKAAESKSENTDVGQPVVYMDPSLYTLRFNIVTTKEKLDKNRDAIVKFLRACVKAGEFISDNPAESRLLVEDWLKMSGTDLDGFFETTSFHVYLNVEEIKKEMLEELMWIKKKQGDILIPDDLSPYIDSSLLKSIDPNLVKN